MSLHLEQYQLQEKLTQEIYDELLSRGYGVTVGKKSYAEIIGGSTSAVDHYIKQGYGCPNYIKLGDKRNSKVLFRLTDVAKYLASQTVLTA